MNRENIKSKIPFFILLMCLAAASINANIIKVALPFFMEEYQIDTTRLIWVAISYTFFQAVLSPILGKIGDVTGYNKIILGGYIIFLSGSIVGGTATGLSGILIARSIQGIGAAAVLPNTIIAAPALFPSRRRGWAIGLTTSVFAAGALIGPALGGLLMEFAGWRTLFLINIPIMLFVFTISFIFRKKQKKAPNKKLVINNLKQSARISIILGCGIIALNIGIYYGWTSLFFLVFILLFLFLGLHFYIQEKKHELCFSYIDLFLNKQLKACFFSGALSFSVIYGISFVSPLLMAIEYNMSPGKIGLLLALANLSRFLVAPFSGSLSDRNGSRLPVQIGFIALFLALSLFFSLIRFYFSESLYLSMIFIGIGAGFVATPATSTVQENSPGDSKGAVIGLYSSFRYVTGMTVQIVLGLLLQPLKNDMHIEQSSPLFNRAFGFIILIVFLGYLFSRALPKNEKMPIGSCN